MDRRAFFKTGATGASGFAAVGPQPLAAAAQRGGSLLFSMDDYLEQMDAGLARIDEWTLAAAVPGATGDHTPADELGRKIIKSLYATAMFRDLDVKDQLHPAMQDRMWALQDTMDEALDGVNELLARQTPASLKRLQEKLRNDPGVIDRVAEFFELEGGRTGVQDQRQDKTRETLEYIGWRLSAQPPSLLIDEYQEKLVRLEATDVESAAYQRWMASQVGERAFWELARQEQSKRQDRLGRGAKGMGMGALVFLGGALLLATGADGLVAVGAVTMTVGSIWFLIGLVTLLIGAATPEDQG